jgi:hypothetical protein
MFIVTLGGVTTGAALLLLSLIRWWFKEKHKPAALVPLVLSLAYGQLVILTAGGLLGYIGALALWGGNGVGYLGLVYGVDGNSPNVTRAHQLALSDGGHVVVVLLTVALAGLIIWAKRIPSWKIVLGSVSGVCLGLSGTIAGLCAVPLASGANLIGLPFTQMVQR